MADKLAAERACKDPNPVIDGRKANVNLAYIGAKPRVTPAATGTILISLSAHNNGCCTVYISTQLKVPFLFHTKHNYRILNTQWCSG